MPGRRALGATHTQTDRKASVVATYFHKMHVMSIMSVAAVTHLRDGLDNIKNMKSPNSSSTFLATLHTPGKKLWPRAETRSGPAPLPGAAAVTSAGENQKASDLTRATKLTAEIQCRRRVLPTCSMVPAPGTN